MGKSESPLEIQLQARIAVLEYLLAQLFRTMYATSGLNMDQIKEQHRKVREILRLQTNPGYDAAMSDLITAEMEIALDHVLEMIEQLWQCYPKPTAKPEGSN
jgi:hypothetical protein